MDDSQRICRCDICGKKIKYSTEKKTYKIHESRICLECAFYKVKAVRILITVMFINGIIIFLSAIFDDTLFKEFSYYKVISLVFCGLTVLIGFVYYIALIFNKIFGKKVRISMKKKNS